MNILRVHLSVCLCCFSLKESCPVSSVKGWEDKAGLFWEVHGSGTRGNRRSCSKGSANEMLGKEISTWGWSNVWTGYPEVWLSLQALRAQLDEVLSSPLRVVPVLWVGGEDQAGRNPVQFVVCESAVTGEKGQWKFKWEQKKLFECYFANAPAYCLFGLDFTDPFSSCNVS